MKRHSLKIIIVIIGAGCSLSTGNSVCDDEICIETQKSVYQPGEMVVSEISNMKGNTVYLDMCSGGIEGFINNEIGWNKSYGMARVCGHYPTQEDIIENMRKIKPGDTLSDTLHVNMQAYEGKWRAVYRFLDEDGKLIPDGLQTSNEFRVAQR